MISIFRLHDKGIYKFNPSNFEEIGGLDGLMGYRYSLANEYSLLESAKRLHSFAIKASPLIAIVIICIMHFISKTDASSIFEALFTNFLFVTIGFYIASLLTLIFPYCIFRKIKFLNSLFVIQMQIEGVMFNEICRLRLAPESEKSA